MKYIINKLNEYRTQEKNQFKKEKETVILNRFKADLGSCYEENKKQLWAHLIKNELNQIENLILNKALTITEKHLILKKIQDDFDVNPKIPPKAICSRIVATNVDTAFEQFYLRNPNVVSKIKNMGQTIDLNVHFPQKTQISNISSWKITILETINKFPDKEKEEALKNFQKLLTWEL